MEIYIILKPTKQLIVCFLLCLFTVQSKGQFSSEFNTYKQKHPEDHSIRLNQETTIIIKLDKGDIQITQEFLEEDLYLNESATYGSKRSLNFSSFFELNAVEAASYSFENGKYREAKVENYKERDELDNSFHDDTKSLNFIFPNLKMGSKSKLKYSEKVNNPRFISPFYFGDFSPIVNNKVTIIADKDINFKFQEFNTKNLNIAFNKTEKKGTYIYTWELQNIKKYDYEEDVPTYKTILPHIVPIITSYKDSNGETIDILNNVSDLYAWYFSLVKDINKEDSDEALIALVDQLTEGKTNDFEKVKAIYYWTQQNIKYIAFEYALGGFIPREANDVFNKKYGDCKDNSSILYKMLEIAGIKGNLTWIGTRTIPYKYSEVPTPIVDNHMILSYKYDGKTYFLDATGRYLPIEFPSSFIQGKEALISKNESEFEIEIVPIMPSQSSIEMDNTTLTIEGEILKGISKTELSGYNKINCFNYLENKTSQEKIKEFYNAQFEKGNNTFLIDNITETNKYDYDKNLILDYTFHVNGYVKKLNDEIYINLNLNKKASSYRTNEDRKNDIEYSHKNYYEFTTTLKIPEGFKLDYVPKDFSSTSDLMSSSITYAINDNEIVYKHTLTLNFLNLNKPQQNEVNQIIKDIEKAYKEIIILKKI